MTTKKYLGSCHCKRVKFEAEVDWSIGTAKCNCTSCWKKRYWSVRVQPEHFKPISGNEFMSGFKDADPKSASGFCKHCGTLTYGYVGVSEWNPKEYVSVSVAALDDLEPNDLLAASVKYHDGLHDNWWEAPKETRHL